MEEEQPSNDFSASHDISSQRTMESSEEKPQSIPQCDEVGCRQSIRSMDESVTEELDRSKEECSIPIHQCPQSDGGGERRSAADEEEKENLSVIEEEKPQADESDEEVSFLQEESVERDDKASPLKEEDEEDEKVPTFEPAVSVVGVDEVMQENAEEKLSQTAEELNGERPQLAEGDEKVYSLQEKSVVKEEEVFKSDEVMKENVEEKLSDFDGAQPVEKLNEEMPRPTEKDVKVSSLQEEFFGEEKKVPIPEISVSLAVVDEIMQENDKHKLSEEQLNEERSQSVGKGKQVSPLQQGSVEENEKVCSLQEDSANRDVKVLSLQEESTEKEKEESAEKDEAEEMDMDEGGPAMAAGKRTASKRKRGRPPVAQGRRSRAPPKPKEDESLCFICFDGGDLVICDHKGCPKVYHPSCVNRDEAYFKAKGHWSCGWHICSNCQKSARYMCYTCTYSLCKGCIKEAEFVCVRGNKGFCEACMKTVMLIETNTCADETMDVVDFDDKNSWLYLFKDYWVDLKAKLSLTIEELTAARNPLKETNAVSGNEKPLDKKRAAQRKEERLENPGNGSDDQEGSSSRSSRCYKESTSRKKVKKQLRNMTNKERPIKEEGGERTCISEDIEWASRELLEFVAHMKDGDRSVLSSFDVQALLLEYIKQNNLRDPRRKSQIVCDSRLWSLFGKSRVGHLEMLKLLEPHFLIKEASPLATDENQGGVVDPDLSQTDAEGNSDASTKMTLDIRRKSHKRVEEKGLINLDDYAAMDVHNVSLMYLRRNLMEDFLDVIDMFNENVVGSFVRIRISGSASNKDMYRLVQVVGTGKAAGQYTTGKKTTDITLEILNLNKREFITIDLISNQEFTEEECKRLRQSVKCGFIDRLTVAEVQEKARALHVVRVNDWLESEKLRLGHLRDRASEKGRKKEHRECVEKLELLSTREERIRRLNEVPEIHVDPTMDPNYDSTEDEDDQSAKRQGSNRVPKSSFKDWNEFSAGRGGSSTWKNSHAAWDSNINAPKAGVQDIVLPTVLADGLSRNQGNDARPISSPRTPKAEVNVTGMDTGVLKNAQPVMEPRQSCGVPPETAPQTQTAKVMPSNTSETEKMWYYQDPTGKIQGPFSMTQLRKWNTSGLFPTNLRIWRTSEKQEDSILLTDALSGKFHKDLQQQEPQHSNSTQPTNAAAMVDSRVNNLGDGGRGNNNPQTPASLPSTGHYNLAKSDRWATQPSSLSTTNMGMVSPIDGSLATSSTGWESSKNSNAWSGQSQVYNSPRPITPFPRNSSQPPSFQGRDGRGENNGRWNGGRGRQNNWNSNKPRRFHHNSRGYERQHPHQISSSQQFPGEQWKVRPANDSSNKLGSRSFNPPAHAPQSNCIDWAKLQGALNSVLPSASSVQPMSCGPSTIPRGNEMQQTPSNPSIPNINLAKTQENVGILSNFQQQNKPSQSAAQVTSGNHAVYSVSSTNEFVGGLDRRQKLESDNSNTTLNNEQASVNVLNAECTQPANSQFNKTGDHTGPLNELVANNKCPEAHNKSPSEKKTVNNTVPCPASVAPNALASSKLPDTSVSVQRLEASSSKAQSAPQCWAPASAQQQGPNNLRVNPTQPPLNMGWGMVQQNPNHGTGTAQGLGNMVHPAIPGAANMGWGMMAQGLMNMTWGTTANPNIGWAPAQATMNANLGWAIPAQGNANANLAWEGQAHVNPNAGWEMPMQINSAPNPGWVAPGTVNANPNPSWVATTERYTNQNVTCGTTMQGTGQGNINSAANQNGAGGKTNSSCEKGSITSSTSRSAERSLLISQERALQ